MLRLSSTFPKPGYVIKEANNVVSRAIILFGGIVITLLLCTRLMSSPKKNYNILFRTFQTLIALFASYSSTSAWVKMKMFPCFVADVSNVLHEQSNVNKTNHIALSFCTRTTHLLLWALWATKKKNTKNGFILCKTSLNG